MLLLALITSVHFIFQPYQSRRLNNNDDFIYLVDLLVLRLDYGKESFIYAFIIYLLVLYYSCTLY